MVAAKRGEAPAEPNEHLLGAQRTEHSHIGRLQAKRVLVVADSCLRGWLSHGASFFFLDKPTEVSATARIHSIQLPTSAHGC